MEEIQKGLLREKKGRNTSNNRKGTLQPMEIDNNLSNFDRNKSRSRSVKSFTQSLKEGAKSVGCW